MSMKFGKKIQSEAIPAWVSHYIDYALLKRTLKRIISKEDASKDRDSSFVLELEKQRAQTSTFFMHNKAQCIKNLESLRQTRTKLANEAINPGKYRIVLESLVISLRTLQEELQDLKKFADLNVMGFNKILKKYDKWAHSNLRTMYTVKLKEEEFYNQQQLTEMIASVTKELYELEHTQMSATRSQTTQGPVEETLYAAFAANDLERFNNILETIGQKDAVTPSIQEALDCLLYKAVASGAKNFVTALLRGDSPAKASMNYRDELQRTILHVLHPECSDVILKAAGTEQLNNLCQQSDLKGRLPLHSFAYTGNHEALNFILKNTSASKLVDTKDNANYTPLLTAASRGNSLCCSVLIEHGASCAICDADQNDPVHLACGCSTFSIKIIEMMIVAGCPVNAQNCFKQTALHIAASVGYQDAVLALLNNGASISAQDAEGCTCIHIAARKGRLGVLKVLVSAIPSDQRHQIVNIQTLDGETALHFAAREDQEDCAEYLISCGAALSIRDNEGWTAEAFAAYVGNLGLAAILHPKDLDIQAVVDQLRRSQKTEIYTPESPLSPISLTPISSLPSSPAAPASPMVVQDLLCRVQFTIKAKTSVGQYVAIIGDRKVLGSWNPTQALPLIRTASSENAEYITWTGHVYLPVKVPTKYRYIIMEGSEIQKWETLPQNRFVQPTAKLMAVDDGTFGINTKLSKDEFIDEGWLISDSQIRIRFKNGGLTLYDSQQPAKVVISSKDPVNTYHTIYFPLSGGDEDNDYVVQAIFQKQKMLQLQFDVYNKSGSVLIGRGVVLPYSFKPMRGLLTVPIINTALTPVGEISFTFVVVTPFEHANLSKALEKTFWKATMVIGHRGGGADSASKIGNVHRSHVQENTLLSFVTASSLGAEYVEFDVQLTSDKVPIIYHNFVIPDPESSSGIEVPIGLITLAQLKSLRAKKASFKDLKRRTKSLSDIRRPKEVEANDNGSHSGDKAFIEDSFPTLEECFQKIPKTTGFNIEMKYPLDESVSRYSLHGIVERNEYVDIVLRIVFDCAGDRKIMFSSFDPDVCTMLSLKQPRYPVFFLTHSGQPNNYFDARCNSIQQAIRFAKSNKLTGLVCESSPLIKTPQLITVIKGSGLVLATYGGGNNKPEYAHLQEQMGVDAIIVDHVAYVSNSLRGKSHLKQVLQIE